MEEQTNNTKKVTKAEKVQANLSAIKLVKALEADNRLADSAEQEILSNYVGWEDLLTISLIVRLIVLQKNVMS